MKLLPALAASFAIAGCATPGSDTHWRKAGATPSDFATDNQGCAARATRMVPTPRPDQPPGGVAVPDNRMDQPPRPWTSAVAEGAYMECMAGRGWRVARR